MTLNFRSTHCNAMYHQKRSPLPTCTLRTLIDRNYIGVADVASDTNIEQCISYILRDFTRDETCG